MSIKVLDVDLGRTETVQYLKKFLLNLTSNELIKQDEHQLSMFQSSMLIRMQDIFTDSDLD